MEEPDPPTQDPPRRPKPKPFWTPLIGKLSDRYFPSCTKRNTIPVNQEEWDTSSVDLFTRTWFTVRQHNLTLNETKRLREKIPYERLPFSPADKSKVGKCTKIKLFPSDKQAKRLQKYIAASRWTYNKCVEAIQLGVPNQKQALRDHCLNSKAPIFKVFKETISKKTGKIKKKHWALKTPYDIRNGAMEDVLTAIKANETMRAKHPGRTYELGFRTKKDKSTSIVINQSHWANHNISFEKWLKYGPELKASQRLPKNLKHDTRLQYTRGEYFLCVLTAKPEREEVNPVPHAKVIALDPGVRTFLTGYDYEGKMIEFGPNDFKYLEGYAFKIDKLQKHIKKAKNHKQRYNRRKAKFRFHKKMGNLVDEMHKKVALYLCQNYNHIILPVFDSQKMVERKINPVTGKPFFRPIKNKTARSMMTWSHYRFRMRLLNKATEFPNCEVNLCTEEYTSKTCSECGIVNHKLGGAKTLNCVNCKKSSDRDFNGARNIFLKELASVY